MCKWIKDAGHLIRLSILTRQLRPCVRAKPTLSSRCLVWQTVCLCSIRPGRCHSQAPSGIWLGLGGRIGLQLHCQHWPPSFPALSTRTGATCQHSDLLLMAFLWQIIILWQFLSFFVWMKEADLVCSNQGASNASCLISFFFLYTYFPLFDYTLSL